MSSVNAGPSLNQGCDVSVARDYGNDTVNNILRMLRQRKSRIVAVQ